MPRTRKPSRPLASARSGSDLLRHAVELWFAEKPARARCLGPLCLLAPGGRAVLLDDLASRALAGGWEVIRRDGDQLGREIAAAWDDDTWGRLRGRFTRARLVVIERLEAVGGSRQQTALSQLFDATPEAIWCVAVESHPLAGSIEVRLAARLAAGLVVPMSPAGCEGDHGGPVWFSAGSTAGTARRRPPSVARIVSVTARHFGLETAAVLGPGRSRSLARARSLAMYLARLLTGSSFATIGRGFAGRDHTTVMHGTRIAAARLATERGFAADVEAILKRLGGDGSGRRTVAGPLSVS